MTRKKFVQVSHDWATQNKRLLQSLEVAMCQDCEGREHEPACPAREIRQQINYLSRTINTGKPPDLA